MSRQVLRLLWLSARTTPLAGPALVGLLLLLLAAHLAFIRPASLGFGPGSATVAGMFARDLGVPLAGALVLLLGVPAVLDGALRRRRTTGTLALQVGLLTRPWALVLVEAAAVSLLLGALALVLAVPFCWLAALGAALPGTWARLTLTLSGAVALGSLTTLLGLLRVGSYGQSVLRALCVQAAAVALLWWQGWVP